MIDQTKIQAFFFDIDGTYYDQITHRIPPSNIQAVKQLQHQGYKVALASARPLSTLKDLPVLEDVHFDGYVTAGGQEVYDQEFHLLKDDRFTLDQLQEIFDIASEHHIPIYAVGDTPFFTMDSPLLSAFKQKFSLTTSTIHPYQGELCSLITLLMEQGFHYEPCYGHLPYLRIQYTGGVNTDLFPAHVTKPTGIHILMAHFQLKPRAYMAFGDSGSDLEMMEDALVSVAMGNGTQEVKACANYICGNSNEDGIYHFLQEQGFIQ